MFNINHVQDVQRINPNEMIVVYGTITMVLTRSLNGWGSRFRVLVKGSENAPDTHYHDAEPTDEDKEFWNELNSLAYDQESKEYECRQKSVRNVINFLQKD